MTTGLKPVIRRARKLKTLEQDRLRFAMAALGVTDEMLAERLGVCRARVIVMRCCRFPGDKLHSRIEAALGYSPVWHSERELACRQRCLEAFGFDPACASMARLCVLARQLGVRWGQVFRKRSKLLAAIYERATIKLSTTTSL